MKMKLLSLLNKILKKFAFLGIFSFTTSAHAQTVYQCFPCPDGKTSSPGAIGVENCFTVSNRQGSVVRDFSTSNGSVELAPGWYRVTMKTSSASRGNNASCGAVSSSYCNLLYSSQYCHDCTGSCSHYLSTTHYKAISASGGAGGSGNTLGYVVYLNQKSTASYTYNGGAPQLVIRGSEDGNTRVFRLSRATNGGNASCNCNIGGRGGRTCSAGGNGSSSQPSVSGTSSKDVGSAAVDGYASGSVSCRITRL